MKPFATFAALATLYLPILFLPATAHAAVPVIVELFTSEGCSSCPPADAALAKLIAQQPVSNAQIIALSYHVDYWNYLGWRDPFSKAAYSHRQEKYRIRFHNENVYTPQMIVAGNAEFLGSDEARARQEIAQAVSQSTQSQITISLAPSEGNYYTVQLSGVPADRSVRLFVAVTEDGLVSQVARGENAGRRLPHVAVVRRLQSLVVKSSTLISLPLGTGEKRENQHIVAWLQDGETGAILSAAQIAR